MSEKIVHRWHGAHHYSDKVHLFLVIFLFLAVATVAWSYFALSSVKINKDIPGPNQINKPTPSSVIYTPTPTSTQVFCTQEAKLCPDGITWVGRTGARCEFSACPGQLCGGIAVAQCASGFYCKLRGNYPDASGTCAKQ